MPRSRNISVSPLDFEIMKVDCTCIIFKHQIRHGTIPYTMHWEEYESISDYKGDFCFMLGSLMRLKLAETNYSVPDNSTLQRMFLVL